MRFYFFLGKPASGKGTQVQKIREVFHAVVFSMGDALKEEIARGTALGKDISGIIASGGLVSDKLVVDVFEVFANKALEEKVPYIIVDGFPRTVGQYRMVAAYLREKGIAAYYIYLPLSDEEIYRRLEGRLVCDKCWVPFSSISTDLKEGDTCPVCGKGHLVRRADDRQDVMAARLREFHAVTEPMIREIEEKEIHFSEYDAALPEDEIFSNIKALLEIKKK